MSALLYLDSAYQTHFEATVLGTGPEGVELDRTLFYPEGGGQPHDEGWLSAADGARWRVNRVSKSSGTVRHQLEPGPSPVDGLAVRGTVDWARRHRNMRYHTAVHLLSGAAFARFGSDITGSQIASTGARLDLALPEARRETAEELIREANLQVEAARRVEVRWVDAAELERTPSLVRVRRDLVPPGERLRLIDIVGFDVQADGGTHVRSTAEVGPIRLDRFENKGARNKRLYVQLEERAPTPPDDPD
ncbi:MAG: alanyl-tRNA editing protein [Thermoplasmata archaeon]|nr:alanyl-tRNA editing protein [Thermoplasmata archaeon]MCI4338633.1 alanyl-tRNA editing protein [Thermoplasmata archaeon]MCI4341485.1 alanyl-tRNA editing protein [Thermoplasmata archaeon]